MDTANLNYDARASPAQSPHSLIPTEGTSASSRGRSRSRSRSQSLGRPAVPLDEVSKHCGLPSHWKPRPQTIFDGEPPVPALSAASIQARDPSRHIDHSSKEQTASDPTSHSLPGDSRSKLNPIPRPQSLFVQTLSDSAPCCSGMSRASETKSNRFKIPDLWSKGSIEKREPKSFVPEDEGSASDEPVHSSPTDDVWQAQRWAWAERRKSAGEALLNQHRLQDELRAEPRFEPNVGDKLAGHPPSALSYLTGRYQGGLQYGYEPGHGLGGSAGTRGASTGASRKSVVMSRDFGLDLSDMPIFVAASPS